MPEKFDIIHSFTHTDYQDILRLGGGTHKEYLFRTDPAYCFFGRMFRRIRPKEKLGLTLERASFPPDASKKIVAVSHRVKDEVIRHYGVPADKIVVIHNGVDANEFKPSEEARRLSGTRSASGNRSTCCSSWAADSGARGSTMRSRPSTASPRRASSSPAKAARGLTRGC